MNIQQFNASREALAEERLAIVTAKRPEYTEGHIDVLNNFKVVAREVGLTPIQVWYVYFRKHVASISQFAKNPDLLQSEPIRGRICDAMNYLELLNALVIENQKTDLPLTHSV
jgi:hypothetical protein